MLKAGAVFSPVNPSTKADKLAYILNNCRAAALITQQKLAAVAADAVDEAPSVALTVVADGEAAPARRLRALERRADGADGRAAAGAPGIDIDLAMLIYTSGSTGFPKGVMMTHQNIVAAATSITTYLENTPDDIILNVLPLSFDYGLYQVLMAVKVGATLVLEKSFAFPQADPRTAAPRRRSPACRWCRPWRRSSCSMRDLEPGALPAPALHHQHRRGAAAGAHRAAAGAVPARRALLDVRPDRVQALHLAAAGRARAPHPGSVGIAIPDTEAYVVDDDGAARRARRRRRARDPRRRT